MKKMLLILQLAMIGLSAGAQIPNKCFKIESILVNACTPGAPCSDSTTCEGKNEMLRFQVGPNPINVGDIVFKWPYNPFLGIINPPTPRTDTLVAQLSRTIIDRTRGDLIQPVGGILPADAQVIVIMSPDVDVSAEPFTTLLDTIYIIVQNKGNNVGHFKNTTNGALSATPNGSSTIKSTILTDTSIGCADTASYDCMLLVNQNWGTSNVNIYGGTTVLNYGALVNFSVSGTTQNTTTVTYTNPGCQAPYINNISTNVILTSSRETDSYLFPNPTNGNFTISFPITTKEITITNTLGQTLQTRTVETPCMASLQSNFEIKENGVYFVQIKTGDRVITKKVIVCR